MQRIALYFTSSVLLAALMSACSSVPPEATANTEPEANQKMPLSLAPVSLYAPSSLNIGAKRDQLESWVIVLSDDKQRAVDLQAPLLVNLDGHITKLHDGSSEVGLDGSTWYLYPASADLVEKMARSDKALIRVKFESGSEVARINGTPSDYLSRPKAYGVQGRLLKFVQSSNDLADSDR